jgi:hypothetical protein
LASLVAFAGESRVDVPGLARDERELLLGQHAGHVLSHEMHLDRTRNHEHRDGERDVAEDDFRLEADGRHDDRRQFSMLKPSRRRCRQPALRQRTSMFHERYRYFYRV